MDNKFIPVCEPYLSGKELEYVTDCLTTGWISSAGKYVDEFEKQFAQYCGAQYAVGVTNGTVAIHLALIALGIGQGDEVIIPNFTMIASAAAVCYTGAVPVFVDAEKGSWNIDTAKIEEKITPKTKAIMPVSIFGHPCEMEEIWRLAKKHNLKVIEDAAESHGAEYNGKKTGNLADITTFSFFANKNLTTGEGGMVLTNNEELYKQVKYFKNLCFPLSGARNYTHEDIGYNYRISNIHAAIGLAQVEKADEYRDMRVKNGQMYKQLLSDIPGISFQEIKPEVLSVYWMNGIVIDPEVFGKTREELIAFLKSNGVDTRTFFVGMNRQPALAKYGCDVKGQYPVTDWLSAHGFYLPSGSSLAENQIERISQLIRGFQKQ
ncbi:MAG: DegT/DnrJ/EryC1/StrS family aminotransferase [Sphingobacteriaceae bacterium]